MAGTLPRDVDALTGRRCPPAQRTCGVNFGGVHRDFLLHAWPCVKRVFAAVCLPFPRQPARPLPVATRRCYATLNIDG